jgi:FAD/FMN-containing dehydrogenase
MVLDGRGSGSLLYLVEFVSNDKQEIAYEIQKARKELASYKFKSRGSVFENPQEIQKYWDIRRDSFKLLTDHSKKLRTAPFIDDVVIPVEHYPEYLVRLTRTSRCS